MKHQQHEETRAATRAAPRWVLPPYEPATPAELERRQKLIKDARRLREAIGPIGIATDDLIHMARADTELTLHEE